ncbi:MAG: hypothetical protein B5M52_07055 [Helicobacteraceae bacterium 4484_230]|nr:MAG: hypothetical protein B5M52_07055 [Helicobacteraceae bacterium 4484_230]
MHKNIFFILLLSIFTLLGYAQENTEVSFFDNNDSMLDLSEYLSRAYGFMPIPSVITEPAVGYGGGAALIYLHDSFIGRKGKSGRNIPASISGIVAGATENGTWLAGAFHLGYYLDDTLRTQTFVGYPDININFYTNRGDPVLMNLSGPALYQSLKYRIGGSDLFVGLGYSYIDLTNTIKSKNTDNLPEGSFVNSGLHFLVDYDTRDNSLSPNRGMIFNANLAFFDKAIGSKYSYRRYMFQELLYLPLFKTLFFDQRFYYSLVSGEEAPFFSYPFIQMRGVPAMKYQGEKVAQYEAQLRWEFHRRWSVLGFVGMGRAYGKDKFFPQLPEIPFKDADTIVSGGAGFRYLIARKFGLRVGIDVAASEEDSAVYIKFGTAWMGL